MKHIITIIGVLSLGAMASAGTYSITKVELVGGKSVVGDADVSHTDTVFPWSASYHCRTNAAAYALSGGTTPSMDDATAVATVRWRVRWEGGATEVPPGATTANQATVSIAGQLAGFGKQYSSAMAVRYVGTAPYSAMATLLDVPWADPAWQTSVSNPPIVPPGPVTHTIGSTVATHRGYLPIGGFLGAPGYIAGGTRQVRYGTLVWSVNANGSSIVGALSTPAGQNVAMTLTEMELRLVSLSGQDLYTDF